MTSNSDILYAIQLFHDGEYDECAPILAGAVANNSILAMEVYGLMLQFGSGVERDVDAAIKVFECAAHLGSGVAAHNLGTLYQTCVIDPKSDADKSLMWFKRAIDLGFVVSSSPNA